jgi:hypothetical protein
MKDGKLLPGKIISLRITKVKPSRGHHFRQFGATNVDSSLRTVTDTLLDSLSDRTVYISVDCDCPIEGRSWEMACVMASWGESKGRTFTGKVQFVTPYGITFDNVSGEGVKDSFAHSLITADDVPSISVLPSHR